jgi:hypothetical protein
LLPLLTSSDAQDQEAPPRGILDHLIKRYREGRISSSDFLELKHWLESDPDVPDGKWLKRFKTGTVAGHWRAPLNFPRTWNGR